MVTALQSEMESFGEVKQRLLEMEAANDEEGDKIGRLMEKVRKFNLRETRNLLLFYILL